MTTPFDEAVSAIAQARYHNHRLETHSDTVSRGLVRDLRLRCPALKADLDAGVVKVWYNVAGPGDRLRKVDLFVGVPDADGKPDIHQCRIAVENKSVITAHRNRTSRFDDLKKVLGAIHGVRPEALLVATVLIGLAERVLNVPDQVHKIYRDRDAEFRAAILPRLSSGDGSLWTEFSWAVSRNRPNDPQKSVDLFRTLPTRSRVHACGRVRLRIAGSGAHRQRRPSGTASSERPGDRC
ncbi:MAG: hypothetical protein HUU26_09700 [Gemmatimonadaceae bacterium]|nr:hypothetical protein [Gemmatimonadaceae bacterium]